MSWLKKLLPPKIKRDSRADKPSAVPEGLWSKCPACEAVLYYTDLESNLQVCPKCNHHHPLNARQRLDMLLDDEGRREIGAEVKPVDIQVQGWQALSRSPGGRANSTGEDDALVVMQGSIHSMPPWWQLLSSAFIGGSMGRWWVSASCVAYKLPSKPRPCSSAWRHPVVRACRKA
jgi:acetyl-CoA carboxylase carboxyl transferase subunit beta